MPKTNTWLAAIAVALAAFTLGRWGGGTATVNAQSDDIPLVEVRPVGADSSLIVNYRKLNKIYVYQNPFIGQPKWGCSYSIQLGKPGGKIERQQCPFDSE